MKISKNSKLDIAYIQLRKGRVKKSIELYPGLIFDFNSKGEVIGIEVLSLSKLAPLLNSQKKRTQSKQAA